MAEKVTLMKLKVDLQCNKCYKKVKKVLAKFPEILDQVFDEKQNIVMIKVVCCSPEKIRDKICCKGGGAIKSIEIVEPKPLDKNKPGSKGDTDKDKSKDKPADSKPTKLPDPVLVPVPVHPPVPPPTCCGQCYNGQRGGPCVYGYVGPPQWYVGYYARPVYDSYGWGRPVYVSRCDQYFSEENPLGCYIL